MFSDVLSGYYWNSFTGTYYGKKCNSAEKYLCLSRIPNNEVFYDLRLKMNPSWLTVTHRFTSFVSCFLNLWDTFIPTCKFPPWQPEAFCLNKILTYSHDFRSWGFKEAIDYKTTRCRHSALKNMCTLKWCFPHNFSETLLHHFILHWTIRTAFCTTNVQFWETSVKYLSRTSYNSRVNTNL